MELIYLDNNATTQPAPEVVAAMLPFLQTAYGNPSSVHRLGQQARQAIDEAHERVATLIGAQPSEITFTGGGTEAINTAMRGLLAVRSPRRRIVTSAVEHSATHELAKKLGRQEAEIVEIEVDEEGRLDLDALAAAVTDQTALVSLLWANNETGVLTPIKEVAAICKARRVPLHVDGTQVIGKLPVDVKAMGIDAMSFAAHKFHGPKGVGGLFARRGVRIPALLVGGPQEVGRRGGTENVPGIVGMGVAAEQAAIHLPDMERVAAQRDRLERALLAAVPSAAVIGGAVARLPNTTSIGFDRLEAEAILLLLSERGLCASAGSACSSGSLEPSRVLRAMKIPDTLGHGAIRLSLSRFTTDGEIERALEIIPPVIERLRRVLPVDVG